MDPRSPISGSPSAPSGPTSTAVTSQSSKNRRGGNSSVLTTGSTGSQIDTTDRYRMGIPGELRPLPLQTHVINAGNPIIELWDSVLKVAINTKLADYGIRSRQVSLWRRTFNDWTPTDEDTTLHIVADQENNDQWVLFLDSVSEYLNEIGLQSLLVEIVDPRAVRGLLTFPIRRDDPILRDWDLTLRPLLRQELRMDLKWTALHAYRRGYDASGNGSVQTVVVFCEDYFADHWKDVSIRIRGILSRLDYEVRLEISQATMRRGILPDSPSTALAASQFEKYPCMGSSIGPEAGSGTLGGYINLIDNQNRAKKFGVTNYQVVRTSAMTTAHDNYGARNAQEAKCAIDIFCPSIMDQKSSVQTNLEIMDHWKVRLEDARQKAEWGRMHAERLVKAELNLKQAVNDASLMEKFQSHFGKVYAVSGFRKAQNEFALDWALIDVDAGRDGANFFPDDIIPELVHMGAHKDGDWTNLVGEITHTSTTSFDTSLPDRERQVFKRGRTTTGTLGVLNRIKPDVVVTDGGMARVYSAWEVMPKDETEHFCLQGDSGAFVLDWKSNVCGLLFGFGEPEIGMGRTVAYLTPIDTVFEDIKSITGDDVSLSIILPPKQAGVDL